MKPIIFDDGGDNVTVGLTESQRCVKIYDDCDEVLIRVQGIDKLIEALQQVKKEINHV